jgi:hypothetical protein
VAQKVLVELVDDIDGTEAVETIKFGIDGQQYEIDLSNTHAKQMRKMLDKYASKGRKIKQQRRRRRTEATA